MAKVLQPGAGRLTVAAALVVLSMTGVVPVLAQPAVGLQPAPEPVFAIRGFQVTGENPLGEDETARILRPYVREDATIGTLQQAAAALEASLRFRGFGLHRVSLPAQEVGQSVRLEIVSFTVSRVAVEGRSIYGLDNVRRTLPELQEGKTPNFKLLAVQTAIANENPNKQVQVGIKEGDEPDRIDATIALREQRPWTFGASLSNSGTPATGRDRLTVTGGHTNLFDRDHQVTAAWTTSIERSSDVKQLGLSYRAPLYALGSVVGASYTKSDVVGNFGAFSSTGAGSTLGVNWTWYLPPEGGRRAYVVAGLDDKIFNASRINSIVVPGAMDRRSRPLTLGYNARIESDRAVWGYDATLALNTASGDGNDLTAYRTEDPRISSVRWKLLRGGANWTSPVGDSRWLFGARAAWQYTPDVLLAGEQIGLGGLTSVRGTTIERPLSADKGLTTSLELTTPELATGLRAVGFLDAGWVRNNGVPTPNKPASDNLSSAGAGLRWNSASVSLTLDYAKLLNGSTVSTAVNNAAPQRGDERVYVNLAVRF